jgi:hypothetical protein
MLPVICIAYDPYNCLSNLIPQGLYVEPHSIKRAASIFPFQVDHCVSFTYLPLSHGTWWLLFKYISVCKVFTLFHGIVTTGTPLKKWSRINWRAWSHKVVSFTYKDSWHYPLTYSILHLEWTGQRYTDNRNSHSSFFAVSQSISPFIRVSLYMHRISGIFLFLSLILHKITLVPMQFDQAFKNIRWDQVIL